MAQTNVTVPLDELDRAKLKEISKNKGVSQAHMIRRLIRVTHFLETNGYVKDGLMTVKDKEGNDRDLFLIL